MVVARKKVPDSWDAFFAVDPEDVLLVVRGGSVVLSDASLEAVVVRRPSSSLRLGATVKRVAEDVPELLACLARYAVRPNLPIDVSGRS